MGRSLAKWDMVLVLAYTLLLCCTSSPKPYTHALLIGPVSSITFCITAEMMLGFHLTEVRKTEGFFSPPGSFYLRSCITDGHAWKLGCSFEAAVRAQGGLFGA